MSNLAREGQLVSYVGDGRDGRVLGERGRVLAVTGGTSGHVKWDDSSITLVDLARDVAPLTSATGAARAPRDELDDSLEVGSFTPPGVLGIYQAQGSLGLLQSLARSGQLSSFASIAAETHQFVEGLLRQDPGLMSATAHLDPEDADELISLATLTLLREASEVSDGG